MGSRALHCFRLFPLCSLKSSTTHIIHVNNLYMYAQFSPNICSNDLLSCWRKKGAFSSSWSPSVLAHFAVPGLHSVHGCCMCILPLLCKQSVLIQHLLNICRLQKALYKCFSFAGTHDFLFYKCSHKERKLHSHFNSQPGSTRT